MPAQRPDVTPGKPPRAPGRRPLLGHTLSVLDAPLETLQRWGETDAPVVRATVAGQHFVVVTTPEPTGQVLRTDSSVYRKADLVRDRLGTLQGGSLVLLEGEQWRTRRGTLQSGFSADRIAAAGSLTTRYTTEMVTEWPTDRSIRADEHSRDLVLAILARALFGLDLRGERTPIHEAADDILARMDLRSVSTYLPEWVPTPTNRRFRRAVATLHERLEATVEGRARSEESGTDLLSTMLSAGLPPETIRDELIALLFAGFDSTATALSCTLGLLADHPDEQAALAAELDAVVGEATLTPAHLEDLDRLDAIVRESLRLFPPQYLLFREPTESVTLAGYALDQGTTVLLAPWILHHQDRFWDAPTAFRPARWLDEDGERPEFAYVPYGGGPRTCIGRNLANQTLKLVLADVCRRRRLTLTADFDVVAGPTLALENGVSIRATLRD